MASHFAAKEIWALWRRNHEIKSSDLSQANPITSFHKVDLGKYAMKFIPLATLTPNAVSSRKF